MTPQPEQQAREDIDRLLQAAGWAVQIQERSACKKRQRVGDADFRNGLIQLDRDVIAPDQIRIVIRSFRNKLFTEIFPGREWVPKTLIFAKGEAETGEHPVNVRPAERVRQGWRTLVFRAERDARAKKHAHAENIVEIVREDKSAGQPIWSHEMRPQGDGTWMCSRQFGKGNDFAQKITYRTTGAKPKDLIKAFQNSAMPRIAVTVDMIATGTDIKALEIVMFLRAVKSRAFFEQMKGRGVRVIKPDDLQSVTATPRSRTTSSS